MPLSVQENEKEERFVRGKFLEYAVYCFFSLAFPLIGVLEFENRAARIVCLLFLMSSFYSVAPAFWGSALFYWKFGEAMDFYRKNGRHLLFPIKEHNALFGMIVDQQTNCIIEKFGNDINYLTNEKVE